MMYNVNASHNSNLHLKRSFSYSAQPKNSLTWKIHTAKQTIFTLTRKIWKTFLNQNAVNEIPAVLVKSTLRSWKQLLQQKHKDPDSEACWSAVCSTGDQRCSGQTRPSQNFCESVCFSSSRSANLCCNSFSLSCCLWTSSLRAWTETTKCWYKWCRIVETCNVVTDFFCLFFGLFIGF